MPEKTITIRISEDQHKDIKIEATKQGLSVKDYLLKLVKEDLDRKQ